MNYNTVSLIDTEMSRQQLKWGLQNHDYDYWLAIALEELGEVAKTVVERKGRPYTKKEIVHTAAVLCSWLEHIERQENGNG